MKLTPSVALLGAFTDAFHLDKSNRVSHGTKMVCYYTNWSQYRPGAGKFYPEDIDADLCSHLIFSFAKVETTSDGWGLGPYEWNDLDESWAEGMYSRFNKLKNKNPELKTLLAIGGWNHGSTGFTDMVQTDSGINSFVRNSMKYIRDNGFDGIDLDWEYPAKCSVNCSPSSDADRFKKLCEVFRREINAEAAADKMLLSAAVGIGWDKVLLKEDEEYPLPSYDPKHMTDHLDFVNLMSYDMHGHWEANTGHQALAHRIQSDDRLDGTTNLDWILNTWITELGADPSKLHLGLAAYGRSFKLENPSNHGYQAPCKAGWTGLYSGDAGEYTREGGYLAYYEVCQRLRNQGWTEVWLEEGQVPYAYGEGDWVGYDTVRSIDIKVNMAKDWGLGGLMWWSIDIDDFNGEFCGQGKYPLMSAAKRNWLSTGTPEVPEIPDTPAPGVTTTTQASSNPPNSSESNPTQKPTDPPSGGGCQEGVFYPDENDCATYHQCNHGSLLTNTCASGLEWDTTINACNWASTVDCCNGQRPCNN